MDNSEAISQVDAASVIGYNPWPSREHNFRAFLPQLKRSE